MTRPRVHFVSEPLFRRAPRGRLEVRTALHAVVDDIAYEVPVGVTTDGASVPPLCWLLVGHPFSPSSLRAAVLHDFLCEQRGWCLRAVYTGPVPPRLSSWQVHRIFHASLLAERVHPLRAWCMFAVVAVFGPRWTLSHQR